MTGNVATHSGSMREGIFGLLLALLTGAVLWLLPPQWARGVASHLLTLIAAIYLGFAIASKGRLPLSRQIAGSAVFVVIALLGLWISWWFLVAGLVLHGGWDYLHHGDAGRGVVPRWYVPFCAVYDGALAVFIALFMASGP